MKVFISTFGEQEKTVILFLWIRFRPITRVTTFSKFSVLQAVFHVLQQRLVLSTVTTTIFSQASFISCPAPRKCHCLHGSLWLFPVLFQSVLHTATWCADQTLRLFAFKSIHGLPSYSCRNLNSSALWQIRPCPPSLTPFLPQLLQGGRSHSLSYLRPAPSFSRGSLSAFRYQLNDTFTSVKPSTVYNTFPHVHNLITI